MWQGNEGRSGEHEQLRTLTTWKEWYAAGMTCHMFISLRKIRVHSSSQTNWTCCVKHFGQFFDSLKQYMALNRQDTECSHFLDHSVEETWRLYYHARLFIQYMFDSRNSRRRLSKQIHFQALMTKHSAVAYIKIF